MPKHFHKPWTKEEYINDILDHNLKVRDENDYTKLEKGLRKLTVNELGILNHYILETHKKN